jgi:hypothetical protein
VIKKKKNFSIQCRVSCAHVSEGVVHVNKDINLRKTLNHTNPQSNIRVIPITNVYVVSTHSEDFKEPNKNTSIVNKYIDYNKPTKYI